MTNRSKHVKASSAPMPKLAIILSLDRITIDNICVIHHLMSNKSLNTGSIVSIWGQVICCTRSKKADQSHSSEKTLGSSTSRRYDTRTISIILKSIWNQNNRWNTKSLTNLRKDETCIWKKFREKHSQLMWYQDLF